MSKRRPVTALAALAAFAAPSCARSSIPTDPPPAAPPSAAPSAASPAPAPASAPAVSSSPAAPAAVELERAPTVDGPRTLQLVPGRSVFYAFPGDPPRSGPRPYRLVGHLHGICHPPAYSCGTWLGAAAGVGALVCPTGNARCGDAATGPPSWEAPSWTELVSIMDADLEHAIAKVAAKHPGSIRREGAVLTGWSRGAFAAPVIARMHPKRWPYLILIEANVPLSAGSLRKAGVRAVALLAGELGTEIAGERKTQRELEEAGFPAKLFVMRRVAHLYPEDMDRLMGEAFDYVLAAAPDAPDAGGDGESPTPLIPPATPARPDAR